MEIQHSYRVKSDDALADREELSEIGYKHGRSNYNVFVHQATDGRLDVNLNDEPIYESYAMLDRENPEEDAAMESDLERIAKNFRTEAEKCGFVFLEEYDVTIY